MNQRLANIAIVVKDYDEAIDFYTRKLHFELVEDTRLSDTKRWVRVKPQGTSDSCCLLLAQAATDAQVASIGNQTGGRVFLFLYTDDIDRDHQNLLIHNIKIVRPLIIEEWGKVIVFADLYGNLWDLIQAHKL